MILLMTVHPVEAQWIEQVRLGRADFDGDGVAEIVVGGRVGPYVASDVPFSMRRARIEILRDGNTIGAPLATTGELRVLEDVTAGDLDGDGEPEVLAVGGGWLTVFKKDGQQLRNVASLHLGGVTARVALSRLGVVAVTVYDIDDEGDSGLTTVSLLALMNGKFVERGDIRVRGHVGDLTFFGLSERRHGLVAETGGGEEGGDASVWDVSLPGSPVPVWSGRVNSGRRALVVTSLGTPHSVAFGSLDGTVSVCEWTGAGLRVVDNVRLGPVEDLLPMASSWLVSSSLGNRPLRNFAR